MTNNRMNLQRVEIEFHHSEDTVNYLDGYVELSVFSPVIAREYASRNLNPPSGAWRYEPGTPRRFSIFEVGEEKVICAYIWAETFEEFVKKAEAAKQDFIQVQHEIKDLETRLDVIKACNPKLKESIAFKETE